MNIRNTLFALVAALGLALVTGPVSATTLIPTAGKTEVQLSNELIGALVFVGVKPGAVGPGTLSRKGVASFPVTTGAVEGLRAEIDHSGGLSLTAGGTRVVLGSFIIDTFGTQSVLTGLIIANGIPIGRAPLFNVDTSEVREEPKGKKLTISNVKLTLSQAAADALNQLFGVTAFTVNFPIGTATVKINNSKVE